MTDATSGRGTSRSTEAWCVLCGWYVPDTRRERECPSCFAAPVLAYPGKEIRDA